MLSLTNEAKFQKDVKKIIKLVPEIQVEVLKKVSFDALRNFQRATPEDTRRAKGGWNTVVDSSPSEWKPPKGMKAYSLQKFNGSGKIKAGSVIHVSNNVEYIIPLDEGHSGQAPIGIMNPVIAGLRAQLSLVLKALSKRKIRI